MLSNSIINSLVSSSATGQFWALEWCYFISQLCVWCLFIASINGCSATEWRRRLIKSNWTRLFRSFALFRWSSQTLVDFSWFFLEFSNFLQQSFLFWPQNFYFSLYFGTPVVHSCEWMWEILRVISKILHRNFALIRVQIKFRTPLCWWFFNLF